MAVDDDDDAEVKRMDEAEVGRIGQKRKATAPARRMTQHQQGDSEQLHPKNKITD